MSLRPTQVDEKRVLSEAALPWKRRPRLCHLDRSAAQRRRKMFANATNSYRKSGVAQRRDLRFSFSALTQTLKPKSLSILYGQLKSWHHTSG